MIKSCCIIGSGNVATHLGRALGRVVDIKQVYSRNINHAEALSSQLPAGCDAIDNPQKLYLHADLYIIAVSDDKIKEVLASLPDVKDAVWIHTSGSIGIDVFDGMRAKYGVLYPLQTFTKSKEIDFAEVPLFVEGSNEDVTSDILSLAAQLSEHTSRLDSEGRCRLHMAAVFACNFVNYMWTIADSQLNMIGQNINILAPLLEETMQKIGQMPPAEAQTGPARRGDRNIINKHCGLLPDREAQIYKILSEQIFKLYNEQN